MRHFSWPLASYFFPSAKASTIPLRKSSKILLQNCTNPLNRQLLGWAFSQNHNHQMTDWVSSPSGHFYCFIVRKINRNCCVNCALLLSNWVNLQWYRGKIYGQESEFFSSQILTKNFHFSTETGSFHRIHSENCIQFIFCINFIGCFIN